MHRNMATLMKHVRASVDRWRHPAGMGFAAACVAEQMKAMAEKMPARAAPRPAAKFPWPVLRSAELPDYGLSGKRTCWLGLPDGEEEMTLRRSLSQ